MEYHKLAKDSMWVFVLSFAAMPLNLLIRMLYARNMTVEEYGLFYGFLAFFSMFSFVREFGTRHAMMYLMTKYYVKKNDNKIKTIYFLCQAFQLTASLMVAGIFILLKSTIVESIFKNQSNAGTIFNFFIIYWIIQTVYLTNISAFNAYAETKVLQAFEFTNLLGVLVFSYALFFIAESYNVPALSYTITTIMLVIITTAYFWSRHKDVFKSKFSYDKSLIKELRKYAFAMLLASASFFIMSQIDPFLIQFILGAKSVAFYTTGISAAALIMAATEPMNLILLPIFTQFWHQKKRKELSVFINAVLNNLVILILPASVFFTIFASQIITLLFGANYLPSQQILQIFAFFFIIRGYVSFLFMCLASVGLPNKYSITITAGLAINVVLDIALIPFFGIIGAAISTTLCYVVMLFIALKYLRKQVHFDFSWKKPAKIAASLAIFIIITFVTNAKLNIVKAFSPGINATINELTAFILGLVCFSAMLIILKAFDYKAIIAIKKIMWVKK